MNIDIEKYYKVVLADLKSSHQKCEDYCLGCYSCQVGRMIEDLQCYYELMIWKVKKNKNNEKEIRLWRAV